MSAVATVIALSAMPGPALAAGTYAWTLTCNTGGNYPGVASASWDWLQDGQVIVGAGGTAACYGGGGGTRPTNANGFTVILTAQAGSKQSSKSATVSFDPAGGFTKSLKASAHDSWTECELDFHFPVCWKDTSSVSATLTMTS